MLRLWVVAGMGAWVIGCNLNVGDNPEVEDLWARDAGLQDPLGENDDPPDNPEDDPDDGPGEEEGVDEPDDPPDVPDAPDEEAPAEPLGPSTDETSLVVYSQSIRQNADAWPLAVRCMGDPACNGLGAIPDLVLLQNASCAHGQAFIDRMSLPVAEGGLGVTTWAQYCADNDDVAGSHWLSNAIIYNSERFTLETPANARRFEYYTGGGLACSFEGRDLPIIKLLDNVRDAAGYSAKRVTVAMRHDDHFGGGVRNRCDAADAPTVFCAWRNSKLIDAELQAAGGGLQLVAGVWNYAAQYCTYEGTPSTNWKYAYRCTTEGLSASCGGIDNLGWRDGLFEYDPNVYASQERVNFVHANRTAAPIVLSHTPRNYMRGIVGTHFYCEGHGPYSGPSDATEDPTRISNHTGRLMRLPY